MLKRTMDFLAGVPMTIVGGVFLLASLALMLTGTPFPLDPAWVTVAISGVPLVYLSLWRIVHNKGMSKISSALLISIAMTAAIAIGDLFAAGEVAFIMAIGAILEEKTTERARKGLKKLIELAPKQGRRIVEGREEMIELDAIRTGDVLRVLPGEALPVDGVIRVGNTSVDQAVLTGESLPVDKEPGDEVFCGTINRFGAIDIEATKVGEDSSLQTLIRMVQEADERKAPMQRIADVCATWLVPLAVLIALVTYLATQDIVRGVTVLVVFCPCALVLATPTAIMAAIGQATKYGVVIKSGEALERMGKVDCIAFDKTGTLTHGNLVVSDVVSFDGSVSDGEVLQATAAVEALSEHPLAKAVMTKAKGEGIEAADVEDFFMEPGKGVSGTVDGRRLNCGNAKWMREVGIAFDEATESVLDRFRDEGKAVIVCARDGRAIGAIALSDTLRTDAPATIEKIRALDTRTVLLTGDHARTAAYFAKRAGIDEVHADLLPAEKVGEVAALQAEGRHVCMVGDGVNDAPALKTADVGIAMGTMGSDIAVEAADIAIMGDDVAKIPYLKRLSNACVNTIKFSIGLSLFINLVAITFSVIGLLNPTTGALVHNAGSVLVVLIAALLYDRKFIDEERPDEPVALTERTLAAEAR